MASVEERFNKIVNNINNQYAKEQSTYERFNNIVNRVSTLSPETIRRSYKSQPIARI